MGAYKPTRDKRKAARKAKVQAAKAERRAVVDKWMGKKK